MIETEDFRTFNAQGFEVLRRLSSETGMEKTFREFVEFDEIERRRIEQEDQEKRAYEIRSKDRDRRTTNDRFTSWYYSGGILRIKK